MNKPFMRRALSLALCLLTVLALVPAAALAAPTSGSVVAGTVVYSGASTTQQLGTISAGGSVTILSETGDFYYITVGGISGYVLKSSMSSTSGSASTTTTGSTTTTTTTGTTAGTTTAPAANVGYITNCDSWVYMRGEPSSSGSKTKVYKNDTLTVLGTSGTYYQVQMTGGATGYVSTKYVAMGSPSAAGSGSTSSAAGDVALESPIQMVSIAKTINMRKAPNSSTKSSNIVKKLTGMKGKVFTVSATNGSGWFKASYGGYTGYVMSADLVSAASLPQLAYATGDKSKDKWGEVVKIDGTNIGSAYGVLYDNNIYCNGMNSSGSDYYYNACSGKKNYFYMLSPQNAPIAVLMTHNMRSSLTGGHYLHHIQNAYLGVSKCESCKKACTSKTSVFQITYEKHTQWQLIGFYEGNTTMRNYGAVNYGVTGAQKDAWIAQILSYCTSSYKGAVLGSATNTDDVMIIITCGDKGSKGGTFLCMLLKGI